MRKKAENESRHNELMNIEKQKEINSALNNELITARAQKDNASRLNDFMNAQSQREIPTEQFSSCQSNNSWPKQASFKFFKNKGQFDKSNIFFI